ncbi:ABC transporter permease [Agromyces sp. MMS24-JH15]|uniref:ABC transporter permease n=1 Tax=Agromyces sp. MMS24-JH15 TaxID=3243765 RepID=UPI0037483AAC
MEHTQVRSAGWRMTPGGRARALTGASGAVMLVAVLAALLVLPVAAVVYGSFRTGSPSAADTQWTLDHYREFWPVVLRSGVLLNSIVLAACCTPLSLLVGGALAFVRERTDLPIRSAITPLIAVGLAVLPTVRAMGWSLTADPDTGIVNAVARRLTGDPDLVVVDITGLAGVILLVSLAGSQICYFRFVGSFSRLGSDLTEASRATGAGRWRTLVRITVPLVWPIVGFVAVVSFVVDLQVFTEPYILGSEPRFLMTAVVDSIRNTSPPDYGFAGVLGVLTIGIALVLGTFQARLAHGRDHTTVRGRVESARPIGIRRGRAAITSAVVGYFALAVAIPILSTTLASFTVAPGDLARYSTAAYQRAFGFTSLASAAQNSAGIAVFGGLAAVAIALVVAVVRIRTRIPGLGAILGVVFLIAFGMPGVVQALGMTWAYTSIPGLGALYGTNALALIALIAVALPVLSQLLHGALGQVSADFEHAAVVAGTPRALAFVRFTIPLLLPTLLSGWFIAALVMFGNLEIPLLLGAPGHPLFMQLVSTMFATGDRSAAAALTVLFLLVVAAVGAVGLLLLRALRRGARVRATAERHAVARSLEDSFA